MVEVGPNSKSLGNHSLYTSSQLATQYTIASSYAGLHGRDAINELYGLSD